MFASDEFHGQGRLPFRLLREEVAIAITSTNTTTAELLEPCYQYYYSLDLSLRVWEFEFGSPTQRVFAALIPVTAVDNFMLFFFPETRGGLEPIVQVL